MHRLTVLLAAAVIVAETASNALAQESSRPTLTITRFEGKLKSGNTADAGADLADAIATRVEESGCCRVMLRAFLPQAVPGKSPSLEAIRDAAVAGRVKYVVAGRAITTRSIPRPTAPSIASLLGQLRPGAPSFPARMPYPIPAPPRPVTLVTLEMRVIDAASGQVLRTVTITRPADANGAVMLADSPEVSDALIRAISDFERQRR
jgi:hypothetical protein